MTDEPTPLPDDNIDLPAIETPSEDDEYEPAPRKESPQSIGDPGRLSIVELSRRKRDQELEAEAGGEGDLEPDPPPEPGTTSEPLKTKAPSPGPSDSEGAKSDELVITVDGERMTVKRSDYEIPGMPDERIIKVAQIEEAAKKRLRDANRRADQATSLIESATKAFNQGKSPDQGDELEEEPPEARPDHAPQAQTTSLDKEKLAEIAERLQVGDAEEGARAVEEIYELAAARGNDPEKIAGLVTSILQQRDHQTEITTALGKFEAENADLVANPMIEEVALTVAAQELRSDMKTLGITDEQLDALGPDKRVLAMAHRNLRLQGHKIPTYDSVLGRVATKLRTTFNLPKPGGDSQARPASASQEQQIRERVERKGHAQPQPRHGGARAGQPQEAKPRSPLDIVNEMRADRRFPTITR